MMGEVWKRSSQCTPHRLYQGDALENALFASPFNFSAPALSSSDTTTVSRDKLLSSGDGTEDGNVDVEVAGEEDGDAEDVELIGSDYTSRNTELWIYLAFRKEIFLLTIDHEASRFEAIMNFITI